MSAVKSALPHPSGTARTDGGDPHQAIAEQAAEWLKLLQTGQASYEQHDACARWRMADPRHEAAWSHLHAVMGRYDGRPPQANLAALQATVRPRPAAGAGHLPAILVKRGILALAVICAAATALWRHVPLAWLLADHRTGGSETLRLDLSGCGTVWLNSASAIDVACDARLRRIVLHRGEILVEPGQARRPGASTVDTIEAIETAAGTVRMPGARVLVRHENDRGTLITVLAASAQFCAGSAGAAACTDLQTGQQLRVAARDSGGPAEAAITISSDAAEAATAWLRR